MKGYLSHLFSIKRSFVVMCVLFLSFFIGFPLHVLQSGKRAIYRDVKDVSVATVVIVFGAGLRPNGSPSDVLRDRLQVAADLYAAGKASRILVSGDNRFVKYNEPEVMRNTLVNDFHVPPEILAVDYAGRSTYETCIRARTIWGVDEAILVSQGFHLSRAIWTCEHLGISSSGVSATLQPYVKGMLFKAREWLAIHKAAWQVSVFPPSYVKGEVEEDLDGAR